jgi:hypothetical protein
MTSHQPGTPEPRPALSQAWMLVLPVTLLILLGLAGLRGAVAAPRWDGPLRHDGLIIGLALEAVLGVLLAGMLWRRSAVSRATQLSGAPVNEVAAKLRGALIFVLGAGMFAVAVATVDTLHLRVPAAKTPPVSLPSVKPAVRPTAHQPPAASFHFPVTAILYGLLIVVLVAAVLLSMWWARRFRLSAGGRSGDFIAEDPQDPEDLREAVGSGRSALRTIDDARAAIIACYVAMESSLAERGATRAVADTPDELLARVTASGLVRGTATARLTVLFYEARFSSHPMDRGQRDAAERALDELAAALAEPAEAGTTS